MKLNDPFGRMAARNEQHYESLRTRLQDAGVVDCRQIDQQMARIRRMQLRGSALALLVALAAAWLQPDAAVVIGALGFLVIAWLLNTGQRAQEHLSRYRREELEPLAEGDSPVPKEANRSKEANKEEDKES